MALPLIALIWLPRQVNFSMQATRLFWSIGIALRFPITLAGTDPGRAHQVAGILSLLVNMLVLYAALAAVPSRRVPQSGADFPRQSSNAPADNTAKIG